METRKSKRNPWAIVLLILMFSCAIAYGTAYLFTHVFNQESFGQYRTMTIANIQGIETTVDGFVYYDGSTVSSIDSSGKVNWSYMVGGNADFSATDYGVAAWTDKTITLIDGRTGTTTYNGTMNEQILDAYVGNKYSAVIIGEETDSTIILMENGGRQVSQILLDDMNVIDFGFFSNGTLLWAMVCDSNGTVPTCTIQTYKPGKEIVGSIKDSEQLSYAVQFQQSQVLVTGDAYLKTFDYTGIENTARRRLVYGWYLASADDSSSDPLMAFVKDSQYRGVSDIRDIRMIRSNLDRVIHMPFGCMDVAASGDTVYGFSADGHMMVYGVNDTKARSFRLGVQIDKVYGVTGDGVAIVGYGGTIYMVNLK